MTFFVTLWKTNNQYIQIFYSNFNLIANKIQTENVISDFWIADEEDKNGLSILVEENGVPLKNLRAKETQKIRKKQFKKLENKAREDGIDTTTSPVSVEQYYSPVYKWKEAGSVYYGQIYSFLTEQGYRSLWLIQTFSNAQSEQLKIGLFFFLIDIGGIFLLYWVSVWFVGHSLKPVEENKKKQEEFIASASHELRSPLAVIKANLSLMKQEKERTEPCSQQIEKECNRMAHLIEDMLLLASTESGRWKVNVETVDVETLLIETYETYFSLCKEKNLRLEIDLPEEEMKHMRGDFMRMKQVLSILMDNALRFSKEGGHIVLRGSMRSSGKRKICIEVEDHGSGILEEKKECIFERFYQADSARSDKQHFGLGLSIAKQLVLLQQGVILCNDTKGGGATFSLYFLEIN